MDHAVRYTENLNSFVDTLLRIPGVRAVENVNGRKFARIVVDNATRYFVDKTTWEVYGAKSNTQFNPRRVYGTLETLNQFNWDTNQPLPGTPAEAAFNARETEIAKSYKKRGRPKKNPTK